MAAAALNNMGLAHGALRQPEQAGKAFAEAEAMYKRIAPESLGLADTFHNQATVRNHVCLERGSIEFFFFF